MILDELNIFSRALDTKGGKVPGAWGAAQGGSAGWTYSAPTLDGDDWKTVAHKTDQTTPTPDVTLTGTLSADGLTLTFAHGSDTVTFERSLVDSGIAYTDVLDWGTDGNDLGTIQGEGHRHDDVMRLLSWFVFVAATANGPLEITWQTSDDEEFGDGNVSELDTVVFGEDDHQIEKGTYAVNGRPLPKGLKRYQRLKVRGTGSGHNGTLMAFVVDVQAP